MLTVTESKRQAKSTFHISTMYCRQTIKNQNIANTVSCVYATEVYSANLFFPMQRLYNIKSLLERRKSFKQWLAVGSFTQLQMNNNFIKSKVNWHFSCMMMPRVLLSCSLYGALTPTTFLPPCKKEKNRFKNTSTFTAIRSTKTYKKKKEKRKLKENMSCLHLEKVFSFRKQVSTDHTDNIGT